MRGIIQIIFYVVLYTIRRKYTFSRIFLPECRQSAPECRQSASLPVLPERQLARRVPILSEYQFCQSASFARVPVLSEYQFYQRQSANFVRAPVFSERQVAVSSFPKRQFDRYVPVLQEYWRT